MPRCCAIAAARTTPFPASPAPPRGRAARSHGGGGGVRSRSAKKPPDQLERGQASSLLLRSAAALFALGFVDAGYSGDWSRIGAISEDTEELIKLAAYAVVPLCLAFVFSPSEDGSTKS